MNKSACVAGILLGLLACALADAGLAPAKAAGTDRPIEARGLEAVALMAVDGNVVIEPDGSVAETRIDTKVDAALARNLQDAMLKWRFHPIRIAGQARRVSTRVRLQLAATRQEGDLYSVKVDSVDFPDAFNKEAVRPDGQPEPITGKSLDPPQYPPEMMTRGVMATVMLAIRVTPEGRAGEVTVVQSQLYEMATRSAMTRHNLRLFENSAISAAKRWTFNVPPGAARDAKAQTVMVPVGYTVFASAASDPTNASGQWLRVQRSARQPVAWLPGEQARSGPSLASAAGGSVSQFGVGPQLEQDVAGMSLQ